jgi:integrase
MASVSIRRREASFQVRYRLGGRGYPYQHAGSFKTQKEAKLRRDLIAGELAAGRNPAALLEAMATPVVVVNAPTLAERFDEFIASRVDVSTSTKALYANARDSLGELAERDPSTLAAADFQAWVAANARLSPRTLAHYLSSIRQVLDFADVEPNPARSKKVRLPADETPEVEAPSNPEWAAILQNAPKRVLLALLLIEAVGLRVAEAVELTFGDVDFAEGRIRVSRARTKRRTAGQRWLPVPPELLDEIAALCPLEDRTIGRRVFSGLTEAAIRNGLALACRNAGLARYGPHALRHRRCSLWLAQGFETVFVKQWSGHSKASLLSDVYGHVITDPDGDEWGSFWLEAYRAQTRPRPPSGFPVGPRWGQERVNAAANGFVEPRRYFKKASGGLL